MSVSERVRDACRAPLNPNKDYQPQNHKRPLPKEEPL